MCQHFSERYDKLVAWFCKWENLTNIHQFKWVASPTGKWLHNKNYHDWKNISRIVLSEPTPPISYVRQVWKDVGTLSEESVGFFRNERSWKVERIWKNWFADVCWDLWRIVVKQMGKEHIQTLQTMIGLAAWYCSAKLLDREHPKWCSKWPPCRLADLADTTIFIHDLFVQSRCWWAYFG